MSIPSTKPLSAMNLSIIVSDVLIHCGPIMEGRNNRGRKGGWQWRTRGSPWRMPLAWMTTDGYNNCTKKSAVNRSGATERLNLSKGRQLEEDLKKTCPMLLPTSVVLIWYRKYPRSYHCLCYIEAVDLCRGPSMSENLAAPLHRSRFCDKSRHWVSKALHKSSLHYMHELPIHYGSRTGDRTVSIKNGLDVHASTTLQCNEWVENYCAICM